MKKVVIMGCGNVGSDVARFVAEEMSDIEIAIADYNLEAAERLANEVGGKAVQFDATVPEDVKRVLNGVDIVFNGVGPFHRFAIPIIEQAIASGVNYVDINDDFDVAIELISTEKFDKAAKEAGVTVIFGAGSTPGLTNILGKWGVDQLDQAHSINIAWGCSFVPNLSVAVVDHLFHCLIGDVPQFIDGQHQNVPAWSGEQRIQLQGSLGTKTFSFSGHAEPAGAIFRVEIEGELENSPTKIIYEVHLLSDTVNDPTSLCAANVVLDVLTGKVTQPGLFSPEAVIEPESFVTRVASKLGGKLYKEIVKLDELY